MTHTRPPQAQSFHLVIVLISRADGSPGQRRVKIAMSGSGQALSARAYMINSSPPCADPLDLTETKIMRGNTVAVWPTCLFPRFARAQMS